MSFAIRATGASSEGADKSLLSILSMWSSLYTRDTSDCFCTPRIFFPIVDIDMTRAKSLGLATVPLLRVNSTS